MRLGRRITSGIAADPPADPAPEDRPAVPATAPEATTSAPAREQVPASAEH